MSILESSRHELRIAHGLTLMTPSPHGWEAFPTPGALTHTRITWALSPPAPQVPGVTPGSPLCPWCFGHPFGEVHNTRTLDWALSPSFRKVLSLYQELGRNTHSPLAIGDGSPCSLRRSLLTCMIFGAQI